MSYELVAISLDNMDVLDHRHHVAASTYGYTWTLANVVNALNKIQQL
jgi:hypothetical protein